VDIVWGHNAIWKVRYKGVLLVVSGHYGIYLLVGWEWLFIPYTWSMFDSCEIRLSGYGNGVTWYCYVSTSMRCFINQWSILKQLLSEI
jgi:hypothetical protein